MGHRLLPVGRHFRGVVLEPPTFHQMAYLARHLRAPDRLELDALGVDPERLATDTPAGTWVARPDAPDYDSPFVDGRRPVCAFGCTPIPGKFEAAPWLVGTDELSRYRRHLVHWSRPVIESWRREFGVLRNFVMASNALHVSWLARLGATFDDPVTIRGHEFVPFTL